MKVAVTGGAGFIGSHIAELFSNNGHKVLVIDDLSSGKISNIPKGVEFEKADIVAADIEKILKKFGAQALSHSAAQISVRESVKDPAYDLKKNILGSMLVFQACKNAGCGNVLYSSTGGALYGDQVAFPAPESHPTYPVSPYGISKMCAEKYLFYFRREFGLRTVALRYSNVYGPRQDPHGEAGVVAIFCLKLLKGETPTINGDGLQTRDFVFVKDVARANLLALESSQSGEFNIGTGLETDIDSVAGELLKISGASLKCKHGPGMPGEQKRSVLDPSLARKVLGWSPEISLNKGLAETWNFFAEIANKK